MVIKFFCWIGGKLRCVNEITSLIPYDIDSYYEACAGSGAVLLNKFRHKFECLNDLDPEIYNLFKVMSDKHKGEILLSRLLKLKHDQGMFITAQAARKNEFKGLTDIEKAEMSFILITQSFNAGRKSYRKNVNQKQYTDILNRNLSEVYKRLQGIEVTNMDATKLIDSTRENDKAFVLLDVPYIHELRGSKNLYPCEMSTQKHEEMLSTIKDANCKIMLCGYRNNTVNDLYDRILLSNGNWKHYKLVDLPKSLQKKKVKDIGEEWVWLNYEPPKFSKYYIDHSSVNW